MRHFAFLRAVFEMIRLYKYRRPDKCSSTIMTRPLEIKKQTSASVMMRAAVTVTKT